MLDIDFLNLESRYGEYLPEYANYSGIPLILNKSMYGINNPVKIFGDELINCLIDVVGFNYPKYQMSIYYKYSLDGSKLVLLYYIGDCVYLYTYEELGKWFVDTLGKIFHVKLLEYAHWFLSIRISKIK